MPDCPCGRGRGRQRGERVLVAASENAGASKGALAEAVRGGVVAFKGRLPAKAVLEALESPFGDPVGGRSG